MSELKINNVSVLTESGGNISIGDIRLPVSGGIKDSAGNNVLSETAGTVTLTADAAVISGSSSGDLVRITQTGSGNALVVEDSANPDSTPFVVDNAGHVGVSFSSTQTTPDAFLQVGVGNRTANGYFYRPTVLIGDRPSGDGNATLEFSPNLAVGNGVTIAVDSSKNLKFFNVTSGIYSERMRIDSSGNIGAPSGTNIYNASDERLKQNITELSGCLQKVLSMRGVSFNWINEFCDSEADKTLYGLIAQELQIVDSNLVDSFSDNTITAGSVTVENPLRVNEKFIIPMLVESIKEQQTLIESQQSQIDALTARIEAIEAN